MNRYWHCRSRCSRVPAVKPSWFALDRCRSADRCSPAGWVGWAAAGRPGSVAAGRVGLVGSGHWADWLEPANWIEQVGSPAADRHSMPADRAPVSLARLGLGLGLSPSPAGRVDYLLSEDRIDRCLSAG